MRCITAKKAISYSLIFQYSRKTVVDLHFHPMTRTRSNFRQGEKNLVWDINKFIRNASSCRATKIILELLQLVALLQWRYMIINQWNHYELNESAERISTKLWRNVLFFLLPLHSPKIHTMKLDRADVRAEIRATKGGEGAFSKAKGPLSIIIILMI